MAEIKPSEITAILRQQLSNSNLEATLEEVGTVLTVGDGIARVYGLMNVQAGELVEFDNGVQAIVQNLEEDNVGVVILGESESINEGDTVKRTKRIASIKVGEGLLGRVINTIGEPIDGKGPISGELYEMPLERKAPGVIYRLIMGNLKSGFKKLILTLVMTFTLTSCNEIIKAINILGINPPREAELELQLERLAIGEPFSFADYCKEEYDTLFLVYPYFNTERADFERLRMSNSLTNTCYANSSFDSLSTLLFINDGVVKAYSVIKTVDADFEPSEVEEHYIFPISPRFIMDKGRTVHIYNK